MVVLVLAAILIFKVEAADIVLQYQVLVMEVAPEGGLL
jgi:hypothetical protein